MAFVVVEGVESLLEIQQIVSEAILDLFDGLVMFCRGDCRLGEYGNGLVGPFPDFPELLAVFLGSEHPVKPLLQEVEGVAVDDQGSIFQCLLEHLVPALAKRQHGHQCGQGFFDFF